MAKMGRRRRTPEDHAHMRKVGKRLKWVREIKGVPQHVVAEMVGVSQAAWSKWEQGERLPDLFTEERLCAQLKISHDYLYDGTLDGVERGLAIRLAALHPELVG